MSKRLSKRSQKETDCSDSDSESEISFNLHRKGPAKRQKLNMSSPKVSPSKEDDFFARLTRHLDLKVDEVQLKLSQQLAPMQSQISTNSESIISIKKSIARLEESQSNAPRNLKKREEINSMKEEKFYLS